MFRTLLRFASLAALALCLAPARAQAQTPTRIYGALSNFDCYNDTGSETEGFEIEIEGIHPEDVYYTWNYSAFGAPSVSAIGTANAPATLIRYASSTRQVPNGGMTHFGVTLRSFTAPGTIKRRWLPRLGSGLPPVEVPLPSHQSQVVVTSGVSHLEDRICNDTHDTVWVLPYTNRVRHEVELEDLMTNNAIVQAGVPAGSGRDHDRPSKLDPGDTWMNDDVADSDDSDSGVYWFKVYADVATRRGNHIDHAPGHLIGTIMDATLLGSLAAHPLVPDTLTISDASVYGGQSLFGTVKLDGTAGPGGAIVTLSATTGGVVPAQVVVPENADTVQFPINTTAVPADTLVTITVTAGGSSLSGAFTDIAPKMWGMSFSPLTVTGGSSTRCTVYLTGPAPTGGTTVQITSNSRYARVPLSVVVPAGQSSVTFTITTRTVVVTTVAAIRATVGTSTYAAGLQITSGLLRGGGRTGDEILNVDGRLL